MTLGTACMPLRTISTKGRGVGDERDQKRKIPATSPPTSEAAQLRYGNGQDTPKPRHQRR
jgi:hypothetical protein